MLTAGTYLAKIARSNRQTRAAHLFAEGQRLAGDGQVRPAIDRFRSALAIDRDHRDYQLALARALVAARRLSDADSILTNLLRRSATDGEANLAMVEDNLIRAERLWQLREAACQGVPSTTSEEALNLVLAKLAE